MIDVRAIHKIAVLSACLAGAIAYITALNPVANSAAGQLRAGPDVTRAEQAQLRYAEEILVRECMRDKGFDYFPTSPQQQPDGRSFPYVVDDVGWAASHGYGGDIQQDIERSQLAGRNVVYLASLDEARQEAYSLAHMGDYREVLQVRLPTGQIVESSTKSCLATARAQLYGDYPTWFGVSTLALNLGPLVTPRVTADPRYAPAEAAWAECMRQHGFQTASPQELQKAIADVPRQSEVDTAVAEATCAGKSGFGSTARELEEQYTLEVSRELGDPVRHYRALRSAALPRAAEVISRS